MKQIIITTIFLSIFWSCDNQARKNITPEKYNEIENELKIQDLDSNLVNGMSYKEVKWNYIDTLLMDICSTQAYGFIDLYPVLNSITPDKNEKSVLVDLLKSIGFKVTNWGRGNWMDGPRIVSFSMSNEQCECQVDKLYYSTEQKNKFKVTERIKCEQRIN